MDSSKHPLWQRLRAFEIDDPGVELTFVRRLARENGWRAKYALRVVEEYKKFVYLAMVAGHEVTPSEQVDQAWHMHLTYTRSYWDKLCGDTLGRPLHHGPTKGGAAEQEKYISLYEQTLASYRRHFGYPPPSDIWPDSATRFGDDLRHVTVNTRRYWIIPKPRLPRWRSEHTSKALLGCACLPLLAAGWNPLNFSGPNFLVFYFTLCGLALVAAVLARSLLRGESRPEEKKPKPLSPYEAACLAGGPKRAVEAAVASMVQSGMLRIEADEPGPVERSYAPFTANGARLRSTKATIYQGQQPRLDTPELERAIFDALQTPAQNVAAVQSAAKDAAAEVEQRLVRRGLIYSPEHLLISQCVAALLMASPLAIGLPKIFFGIQRGKPVGFLLLACFATFMAAIVMFAWKHYRTSYGSRVLQDYELKYQPQRAQARLSGATVGFSPGELGMMVGLFGASMLVSGPLGPIYRRPTHYESGDGGGCSSGGDGGGGGGCGGGGCGGGCGGCGGCGG